MEPSLIQFLWQIWFTQGVTHSALSPSEQFAIHVGRSEKQINGGVVVVVGTVVVVVGTVVVVVGTVVVVVGTVVVSVVVTVIGSVVGPVVIIVKFLSETSTYRSRKIIPIKNLCKRLESKFFGILTPIYIWVPR